MVCCVAILWSMISALPTWPYVTSLPPFSTVSVHRKRRHLPTNVFDQDPFQTFQPGRHVASFDAAMSQYMMLLSCIVVGVFIYRYIDICI